MTRNAFHRILALVLCLVLLVGFVPEVEAAKKKQLTVSFTVTTYQNRVRELVKKINTYRKQNGVPPLVMADELEDAAIQRSAELFVLYDHVRPNMTDFDTVIQDYPKLDNGGAISELAATDFTKAEDVFLSWEEDFSDYLLDSEYTHVGIGCIYLKDSNNEYYWVMILQQQPEDFKGKEAAATVKAGKTKTVSVVIDDEMYAHADQTHSRFELQVNDLNLKGKSTGQPTVYLYDKYDVKIGKCDLSTLSFKSSNTSVFTVDATGTVKKKKNGTGTLTVSSKGLENATCTVTISGSGSSSSSSSSSSATVTAATIGDATPELTLKEYSKHKVLSVNLKGSSGYVLYRSTSKTGTYTKCDEQATTKRWDIRIENEDVTKTYYYKVRAYKNSGGKRVYSEYSDPVKVAP
ncbi:MAG: CAP domain-containing protein [Clostridia bacterium]|nr:CAP domain-containing protein [Clostridia bacterium]